VINPIAAYLIVLHQQDLLDEARRQQLAHRVELANQSVPAWRRILATGAQRLSDGFASAARTFDPDIDCVDAAAA
jgi:hypothetical protein